MRFAFLLGSLTILVSASLSAPTTLFPPELTSLFTDEVNAQIEDKLRTLGDDLRDLDLLLDPLDSFHRELQERPCNASFTMTTADEIRNMIGLFLQAFLPSGTLGTAESTLLSVVKYDLQVSKVCLSCQDVGQAEINQFQTVSSNSKYAFPAYCTSGFYGYDATQSALVFAPIDNTTGQVFSGKLRGFVHARGAQVNINAGPSDRWPLSVSAVLGSSNVTFQNKVLLFRDFLASSVAATAGAISILPDFIGFGASKSFSRPFLAPLPYEQAFAMSWLATQKFIESSSRGCTNLDNVATVSGYSEGGYAAVVGALALQQLGVRILSLHPGGGPYNVDIEVGFGLCK